MWAACHQSPVTLAGVGEGKLAPVVLEASVLRCDGQIFNLLKDQF